MQLVLQNILRFIILVLVQVFVLDNIQFLGYVSPMIYVLFILSLPIRFPKGAILILAFILGIVIDIFNNTMGIHTFATVFVAFLRPALIKMSVSIEEMANPVPSFRTFGVGNYIKYVIFVVLIHHTVLFLIESFSFLHLSLLIPKILVSSVVSILIILGIQSFKSK
ncbi:MAG: rod shape-determining protein MreD [Paludibacteraceae bacterium]